MDDKREESVEDVKERLNKDVRDDAKAAEEALSKMNDALKATVEEIKDWWASDNRDSVMSRFRLGERLKKVYLDKTKNREKVYGKKAIERLSLALVMSVPFIY